MANSAPFVPGWVSPPGATITTIMRERGLAPGDFAKLLRRTISEVEDLLRGSASITMDLAHQLATVLGSSASFWTNRESQYRADLTRLEREASLPDSLEWLKEIPLKDMARLGWVSADADMTTAVVSCLRFFGVPSVKTWRETYHEALQALALRTSATFESLPGAVAAWLRQGEIAAASIKCAPWDPDLFRHELGAIRTLTRKHHPDDFLPELERICAACGVRVVILRAPKMCKASGSALFLSPTMPLLLLSFRYLSDDHFWFTFFHEAGHLLLHGNRCIFFEGKGMISNIEEEEANTFATETLIPTEFQAEMLGLPVEGRAVIRFAQRIGISPGIVVGQLQHHEVFRHNQLNDLKRRYQWSDD